MRYSLADPIHVAFFGTRAVILDIRSDRYRLLNGRAAALIAGLPTEIDEPDIVLATALVASGILREGSHPRRDLRLGSFVPASSSIFDSDARHSGAISAMAARIGMIGAITSLRWRGLENTLSRIASARIDRPDLLPQSRSFDLARSFLAVRARIPLKRVCLRDSLALHGLLQRAGCPSTLVFGVRLDPFGAHCWLQSGPVVLNDSLDRTAIFTPILVL